MEPRYGALGMFTKEEAERENIVNAIKTSTTLEGMFILKEYKDKIVKHSKPYFLAANSEELFKIFEAEMNL